MKAAVVLSLLLVAALIALFGGRDRLQANEHPTASFDWSMADRFGLDENGDGMVDYFPQTSDRPGLTGEIDPGEFEVTLDACDTTGDAPIESYGWTIDGVALATLPACAINATLAEGSYEVEVIATDDEGDEGTLTKTVIVQDWLIVALGDSYGSGEGNPDKPIPGFRFDDLEQAQLDLAADQAAYDAAYAAWATLDSDYDDTVAAVAAVAVPCGWRDTNGNGLYDSWSLLDVNAFACADALITATLEAFDDSLDLLGEVLNDLITTAQAALDVALGALDVAFATLQDAVDNVAEAAENFKATWQDRRCHRSALAGSALAALELEDMDPRSSVTFVHLACSGAEANAGLVNPYQGVDIEVEDQPLDCENEPEICLPPQIERAAELVGDREIDILQVSIGGNDANFGPIVIACITLEPCNVPPPTLDPVIVGGVAVTCVALVGIVLAPFCVDYLDDIVAGAIADGTADELFADGSAELQRNEAETGLYQQMAVQFDDMLPDLPDARVFLSQYPNALHNDDGSFCPDANPLNNPPGMSLAESVFADLTVTVGLNDLVEDNAGEEDWVFVDEVYDAFATHGYCADDHFMVRLTETFPSQGNHTGMMHPNIHGQRVYRDKMLDKWLPDLYAGGDVNSPRRPEQPPVADAGGPYAVNEGSSVVLDGTGSYSPDLDAITFQWTPTLFFDGSTLTDSTTATPTFHAVDNGPHVVVLTVTDDDGFDIDLEVVAVTNVDPAVSVGADATVDEGETFSRAGSFTDPGILDTHTATVDYGDGTGTQPLALTAAKTFTLSHVYADDGAYPVLVCVTDDDGGSGCDGLLVTVDNVDPTVAAGADAAANEGQTISLAPATFNDKGTLDTHTATIDWGDGAPVEPGTVSEAPFGPPGSTSGANGSVAGSHVYADDGLYTVTVCVTDDDGGAACDALEVTISNVAPTVDAGADTTVNEGAAVSLDPATFNDRGTLDTHTATIDWGDGTPVESGTVAEAPFGPPGSTSGASGTISGSHEYGDNGLYTVTVCVTDDDGASTCDTLQITVFNVPPSMTIDEVALGAPFVLILVPFGFQASFTDPGFLDTHTATVDWGDGSPIQSLGSVIGSVSATHAYAASGLFTITITVTDDDGGSDIETAVIEAIDPIEAVSRIIDELEAIAADPGTNAAARARILAALADLQGNGGTAANGAFTLLDTGQWSAALEKIEQALYELKAARTADPDLDLGFSELILAWAAKSVANDLIADAEAVAVSRGQIKAVNEAKTLVAQGDLLLLGGNYAQAVDKYQKAVGKVD
ncbi:MAG: PKD domain-containing protein [Dehalococcoidia bacterium]|nr:PKD domain-containing protein [Dehalococcoidia bacterium]